MAKDSAIGVGYCERNRQKLRKLMCVFRFDTYRIPRIRVHSCPEWSRLFILKIQYKFKIIEGGGFYDTLLGAYQTKFVTENSKIILK